MNSQKHLHIRTIAAMRDLAAKAGTAKQRRERERKLAEYIRFGVEQGWNDAAGNEL